MKYFKTSDLIQRTILLDKDEQAKILVLFNHCFDEILFWKDQVTIHPPPEWAT